MLLVTAYKAWRSSCERLMHVHATCSWSCFSAAASLLRMQSSLCGAPGGDMACGGPPFSTLRRARTSSSSLLPRHSSAPPSTPRVAQQRACLVRATKRELAASAGAIVLGAQNDHQAKAGAALGVPKRPLTEDLAISEVVKGCWQLAGGHTGERKSDRTAGKSAVEDFKAFVDAGITTFDTADIYGPSESLIGEYISQRKGGREGLQILTKCCKFGGQQTGITRKSIAEDVTRSLTRLRVPYVDLVQLYWNDYGVQHWVDAALFLNDEARFSTIPGALKEELRVAAGRVRHVGVTNFDVKHLQAIVDAGVNVVSNQVQYSLLDRRPENVMGSYCAAHSIKLLAFGVLGGGLISDRAFEEARASIDTFSKRKYEGSIMRSGGHAWYRKLLAILHDVAARKQTSIANIASRWVLDKPLVAGILVGARNASHVPDHVALARVRLDDEDVARITSVLDSGTPARGDVYDWERGGAW